MREFASDWLKFRNKDSVLFLLFAISLNVCFKGALGTFLTLNGYGLSIVSPPLAFFFAAFDTLIAIGLFFVVDKFHGKKLRLTVYHIVIIGSIVFFYGNYLIYEYFRTFINWGLICFNGAGTKELMSYIAGSKGGIALLFSFAAVILLIISGKRKLIKVFYGHQTMILALVIINLAVYIFLAQFGRAETGKMARNPGVELFTSILNEAVFRHDTAYPEGFSAPASLIFGKEESTEKTTGEISHNRIDNVLVIMIESFPLDMTVFGNSSENSFKIFDSLKESSIVFTSYRTVFPGTSRSFISANCGSLPGTAQETITNYMPDFRCFSIAEAFGKSGFQTGFFGSALFTYDNLSSGIFAKKYNVFKDFNSLKKKYGSDGKMYSYQVKDEDTLKEAFGFMKDVSDKGEKFFTYTFLYSTHYPYESPLS
ncbi:MAG TPA: sulfatase-like hydrolase/transferase, partial [bacterium]|nr:sulfatase-like hydrolase/transferase [bacterium]